MILRRLFFALILISVGILVSCSPKGTSSILSFFFDGVNDSIQLSDQERKDTLQEAGSSSLSADASVIPVSTTFYHSPYLKQECSKCHDSNNKSQTRLPQLQLCQSCHPLHLENYSYIHGPVASGHCTHCHAPHQSQYSKLLRDKGNQICLPCHTANDLTKIKAHHASMEQECIHCHNAHGSGKKFLLR